jgi:hypothetical protein
LKKSFYLLLFYIPFLFVSSAYSKNLKIGVVEYPPHIIFQDDHISGKLFDYINEVLSPLHYDIEIIRLPNGRGALELRKGNIDLLLPYDDITDNIATLTSSLFHPVPGLCFKKENFIPILSATHRFKDLNVGVPLGTPIVPALKNSEAILLEIKGGDAISRGVALTQIGRIDAFYHPSPAKVYHQENKAYKEIACSYFHGYSNGVFIAVSPFMKQKDFQVIDARLKEAMAVMTYSYYFAK